MAIDIDESGRPILLVTFTGPMSEEAFAAYLARMTVVVGGCREKNVTILDATRADRPSAVQRKLQADWLRDNAEILARYSLGTVFVLHSPMVRGALTAILWMQPLRQAHAVVGTLEEARSWANERLRLAGIAPAR